MITIPFILTGRSYSDAHSLPQEMELEEGACVDDALAWIAERIDGDSPLPPSCLVALAGQHLGTVASHQNPPLSDGQELVLIAPVAGG